MGLTPQQVFTWRRQARQPAGADADAEVPQFVPAVVESALPARRGSPAAAQADAPGGSEPLACIEVEIEGVTVRIGRGAEAKTVAAVLRA